MHVTASYLVFLFNLESAQLELYVIMVRKGIPLADATQIAIVRMFYSGYNKKEILKALDIVEGSFWCTLEQWQTNCHFCKHSMGIIESLVCHGCTNCSC